MHALRARLNERMDKMTVEKNAKAGAITLLAYTVATGAATLSFLGVALTENIATWVASVAIVIGAVMSILALLSGAILTYSHHQAMDKLDDVKPNARKGLGALLTYTASLGVVVVAFFTLATSQDPAIWYIALLTVGGIAAIFFVLLMSGDLVNSHYTPAEEPNEQTTSELPFQIMVYTPAEEPDEQTVEEEQTVGKGY